MSNSEHVLILAFPALSNVHAELGPELKGELGEGLKSAVDTASLRKLLAGQDSAQKTFVVFLSESFASDSIKVVRDLKNKHAVHWVYVLSKANFDNRLRAMAAGVKVVLQEPLMGRQVLESFKDLALQAPNKGGLSAGGARKKQQPFRLESEELTKNTPAREHSIAAENAKASHSSGTRSYIDSRPHWRALAEKQAVILELSSDEIRKRLQTQLSDMMSELGQGVIELMSVKAGADPQDRNYARPLASSQSVEVGPITNVLWLPSLLAAMKGKSPVIIKELSKELFGEGVPSREVEKLMSEAKSLAAIPLMVGEEVEGVVSLKFPNGIDPEVEAFIADLQSFAPELLKVFLRLDFLSRVYKGTDF